MYTQPLLTLTTDSQLESFWVVFDLDGTLADDSHRIGLIQRDEPKWDKYFAQCGGDTPIISTILMTQLFARAGAEIVIMTGRSGQVKDLTVSWLNTYNVYFHDLFMRPEGDITTPNKELKSAWVQELYTEDPYKHILCAFEDLKNLVDFWRHTVGTWCFQVQENDCSF